MKNNLYASTLLKAFDILDCFEDDSHEIGIKEISSQIHMPQSSVYRIIQSLEFIGMIFQNNENRKYRLGAKLISLSEKFDSLNKYMRVVIKHMEALGQETGETVNLAISNCDKITYIHRVDCQHILRPNFDLHVSYPAYKTGLGIVLLAELNEASLQWVYQNNAEDIGVPYEVFVRTIHEARKNGYAFDDQVFCPGLRCVAAPVRGPGGRVLFSVSVSAPTLRMDDETYQATRHLVLKYTHAASEEIQGME